MMKYVIFDDHSEYKEYVDCELEKKNENTGNHERREEVLTDKQIAKSYGGRNKVE